MVSCNALVQAETKGGLNVGNFGEQIETFKEYLHRNHGCFLANREFHPFLAKQGNPRKNRMPLKKCNKTQIELTWTQEEFKNWWNDHLREHLVPGPLTDENKELVMRLLEMSALVLTSSAISDPCSTDSDSHLILLK